MYFNTPNLGGICIPEILRSTSLFGDWCGITARSCDLRPGDNFQSQASCVRAKSSNRHLALIDSEESEDNMLTSRQTFTCQGCIFSLSYIAPKSQFFWLIRRASQSRDTCAFRCNTQPTFVGWGKAWVANSSTDVGRLCEMMALAAHVHAASKVSLKRRLASIRVHYGPLSGSDSCIRLVSAMPKFWVSTRRNLS